MRISAAAGCQSFITSTGCVDLWDPKVLRCAAGGHFYVPVHYNLNWEEIKTFIKDKRVFLADNNIPGEKLFSDYLFIVSCVFEIFFGFYVYYTTQVVINGFSEKTLANVP